jgi:excisionase family DNA binding protein
METIYAIPEVAAYPRMSKSKVDFLAKKWQIPIIRIGTNVRIRQSDLMNWWDE